MAAGSPTIVVIGGPNGAGKSTIAPPMIERAFGQLEFVNADTIAKGLSGLDPNRQAFAAGRIMLEHIAELAQARRDFAFESTLASRTFAPFLRRLIENGYSAHLLYVWVSTADIAVMRVKARVETGGHWVEEQVVRRRFARSAQNLFRLYLPLAQTWEVIENANLHGPVLLASSDPSGAMIVHEPTKWRLLERYK